MRGVNISVLRINVLRRSIILFGIATVGVVVACIGPNYDSVHFYSDWNSVKIDFGRVPQEVMVTGWNDEPVRAGSIYDQGIPPFENYSNEPLTEEKEDQNRWGHDKKSFEKFRNTIHRARNLEVRHRYRDAIGVFRSLSHAQRILSLAKDREELLEAGATSSTKGYEEYLKNRYLLEFGYAKQKEDAIQALRNLKPDQRIKPHIQYALASVADKKVAAYLAISKDYPNNPRAEAALVMAARAQVEYNSLEQNWDKGIQTFQTLLKKYPRSRFQDTIFGWLAADELKKNNTVKAVSYYQKQSRSNNAWEAWKGHQGLAEIAKSERRNADAIVHWLIQRSIPVSTHFRYSAVQQIRNCFSSVKSKDVIAVQSKISHNSDLLASYLDFRLEDTHITPSQERNLLEFASTSLNSTSGGSKSAYSRLAQLQFNAGRYRDAIRLARRATSDKGDTGARAMYIEGSSLARLGRNQSAIQVLENLVHRKTKPYIHQSAAECLALLHETNGDPRRSLELYRDLKYDSDYAFVADSVLTPNQLRSAITKVKPGKDRNALMYTLAMRFFRKEEYSSAKAILSKMDKKTRIQKGLNSKEYKEFVELTYFEKIDHKEADPLKDVTTMQRLRFQANHAGSKKARATALYGLAQYAHNRRNLMYYSAGIWRGGRADVFGLYWNEEVNKGIGERRAWAGAFEHECEAQVVKFCEELIRKYPHSEVAPKALYTAGVATERLCTLNSWWESKRTPMMLKAARYMKKLLAKYPHSPLAKPAAKYANEFAEEAKPSF